MKGHTNTAGRDGTAGGRVSARRVSSVFMGLAMLLATFVRLLGLAPPSRKQAALEAVGGLPLPPLKFRADGTFQISIFEDLHFGESTWCLAGVCVENMC